MEPVRIITGRAVPLDRTDVDTDQIIPSDWLKRIEKSGFGKGLFSEWRDDRNFVLNDERYAGATILVAGSNFGIGSSREHAVWALVDYGFRVVISPRFGDIFRLNSTRSGLVPAEVEPGVERKLIDLLVEDPTAELTVDVETTTIEVPAIGLEASFRIDEGARQRLLNGLDDIGVTMQFAAEIDSFETARPSFLPTT